jgi:hypothetical protein
MPLSKDFTGIGMPPAFAQLEGFNPAVAVTAAGTTTADATLLLRAQNWVLMTATGSDGVRLPAGTTQLRPHVVSNVSAGAGLVYPPTGGNFTGGTTDAGISVPARKTILCWRYSATGWAYNLSA